MKKSFVILLIVLASNSGWSQGFDPDDNSIYYTIPGPSVVQAQLVAGVYQDINTFPVVRFNNVGSVNGLGCNPLDSCLYYINNSSGQCHLYKMDATGLCTLVSSTMLNYTVNGGVDACGNYIQYQASTMIKTNIQTGVATTYNVPNLGFITDVDYNPYSCNFFSVFYNQGNMLEVDTNGVLLQTFLSPQAGTNQVGGMAINSDGTEILLSKLGNIYSYNIFTGAYISTTPLNVSAAGAPIADLATFQFDNIVADITNAGPDTLYFVTCADSLDVSFANYSTGALNNLLWDFGDGTTDNVLAPTHKFQSNNTYEVIFLAERFACETCQTNADNYDTIYVEILPDVLQTTMISSDPLCVTSADGTANVSNIVGGNAPYVYLWPASGNITASENSLDAGWAYVEVTGANGCYNLDSVLLTNPAAVEINLLLTDASCFSFTDGSAVASPLNLPATYTYAWSSSANVNPTENNLGAGNHSVIVTNLAGCDTTYSFSITEPTEVTVVAFADTTVCIGGTALLDAIPAGGNGGYTIIWTGQGAGIQNVNPIVASCYDVQAQDVNGCLSQIDQLCITLEAPLNMSVSGNDICPQSDAQLTSITNGGLGTYNYVWDIAGTQIGTNANLTNPQTTATTYCLTVSDQCETPAVNQCVTIDVFSEPVLNLTPQTICEDETILFTNPALNPSEVLSFSWQFGDGAQGSGNQPSHLYPYSGLYTVTIDLISADNCAFQTIFPDVINVNAIPTVTFNYNPQSVTVENTEVDFFNSTTNGLNYVWDFGDNSSLSSEENPSHIFPANPGANYQVTLYAYNDVCVDSVSQVVFVEDIIIYYIPNAFTPDGDQFNEEFKPVITSGIDIYDYHFTIFNRWGEIVFESYNADFGWNGHYGDGGLVADGTYVWALEFGETMTDKQYKNGGHVTVLK
jgi:gliding motility-associated-like protein